jgi:hypothetical protein
MGAMAASMWGGGAGRAVLVWKRRGSHPSGVEEAGIKRCGRGGRGAGVKDTGPSHPGNMGSGVEGSGPNTSVGSGAGASSTRIRETRTKQVRASGHAQPSEHPSASLFRYNL